MSSRPTKTPNGAWPLEMRAQTAAAYCDESSVDSFLRKVARGIYSKPTRIKGCLPKWHRMRLDEDIAARHNLRFDTTLAEDAAELV